MGNDTPLITVYTQVYNREQYLEKCIESVLNQTYTNFEYYICNHGSTDKTQEIIDKYAAIDSRIKPFYYDNVERGFYPDYIKEHSGGEYFAMLDSDDWWREDYLEKLVSFAEENQLDMAICSVDQYLESEDKSDYFRKVDVPIIVDMKDINHYWNDAFDFFRTTWGRIIKMDIMRQADLSVYYENAKEFSAEDTAFTLANLAHCKRIGFSPEELITYRITDASISRGYKKTSVMNNYRIYLLCLDVLKSLGDNDENSKTVMFIYFIQELNAVFDGLFGCDMSVDEKNKELDRVLNIDIIKVIMSNFTGEQIEFINKIQEWQKLHN